MKPVRFLPLLGICALLQLVPAPAMAQYRRPPARRQNWEHAYEFTPNLTFNHFDDSAFLDDEVGVGFRFGYLYTPNHEIEFLADGVSTNDSTFTFEKVDINNFQAAYVYNFTKRDVVPYVTAGLGFKHTHDDTLGSETDLSEGVGGGVRFFIGRALYFRVEGRRDRFKGSGHVYADGEYFYTNQLMLGLGWRIGAP
ncbi:MAG TPA: outer membrane beta-barrel protein [Candidatus Polarisedimenticolia bacterium]